MDRKEVFAILLAAGKEINNTAILKGFWKDKDNRNRKEMCMLMISELGEALEADRKQRFCTLTSGSTTLVENKDRLNKEPFDKEWIELFELFVKDSVQDEIADTIIRVLDYVYGFEISVNDDKFRFLTVSSGNFAEDLETISFRILSAQRAEGIRYIEIKDSWQIVLKNLIAFCDWWNIDILTHVRWKMIYNTTRPKLHGKKY